jgi:hypothetical protein
LSEILPSSNWQFQHFRQQRKHGLIPGRGEILVFPQRPDSNTKRLYCRRLESNGSLFCPTNLYLSYFKDNSDVLLLGIVLGVMPIICKLQNRVPEYQLHGVTIDLTSITAFKHTIILLPIWRHHYGDCEEDYLLLLLLCWFLAWLILWP